MGDLGNLNSWKDIGPTDFEKNKPFMTATWPIFFTDNSRTCVFCRVGNQYVFFGVHGGYSWAKYERNH